MDRTLEQLIPGQFKQMADTNEPQWLQTARRKAVAFFNEQGLPHSKIEEWRKTDIVPLKQIPFELPVSYAVPAGYLSVWDSFFSPDYTLTVCNGQLNSEKEQESNSTKGILIHSSITTPDFEPDKELIAAWEKNRSLHFSAINTALFHECLFITITKDFPAGATLLINYHTGSTDTPIHSLPKVSILVEPDCCVKIVEIYTGSGTQPYLSNSVTDITLAHNTQIEYLKIQDDKSDSFHINQVVINQKENSTFNSHHIDIGSALSRTDIEVNFDEERSTCSLHGLVPGKGWQVHDVHTTINHKAPSCKSFELYKLVSGDKSRLVFNGLIHVESNALKTDAFQRNNGLLLSNTARINAQPQLEICADEVSCSHGATLGHINDEQLFYLITRGIDEKTARSILLGAFVNEAIEKIGNSGILNYINTYLYKYFVK